MKKQTYLLLTLCILSFLGHFLVFFQMPDTVPIHWNVSGEPDGYANKLATLFLALLPLLMLGLLNVIPKIDPRGKNYEKHKKAYDVFSLCLILLLIAVNWISNGAILGYPVSISRLVPTGVGFLLIAVGNYMPQLRTNYTMGIKNPWTLESEWVWKKTHAMSGMVFCLMGVAMALNGIFQTVLMSRIAFGAVLGGVVFLEFYSYLLYRKWKKAEAHKEVL